MQAIHTMQLGFYRPTDQSCTDRRKGTILYIKHASICKCKIYMFKNVWPASIYQPQHAVDRFLPLCLHPTRCQVNLHTCQGAMPRRRSHFRYLHSLLTHSRSLSFTLLLRDGGLHALACMHPQRLRHQEAVIGPLPAKVTSIEARTA